MLIFYDENFWIEFENYYTDFFIENTNPFFKSFHE